MAFGQQSGPPASRKQMEYLEALVRKTGHDGFRHARHPLGLTQRQAGGKFTKDEASALIDRLLARGGDEDGPAPEGTSGSDDASPSDSQPTGGSPAMVRAAERRAAQRRQALADLPADLLADELRRRGWTVTEA